MQRIHVSPALGKRRVEAVKRQDVERLARAMLASGAAPKTVRNVMTVLHSVWSSRSSNRGELVALVSPERSTSSRRRWPRGQPATRTCGSSPP
jgi:hypothetical protein